MNGPSRLIGILAIALAFWLGTTARWVEAQGGGATAALQTTLNTLVGALLTEATFNNFVAGLAQEGSDGEPSPNTGPSVKLKASTDLSAVTAVDDNDQVPTRADVTGRQLVLPGCIRQNRVRDRLTNTDGASAAFTGTAAAPGASKYLEIWWAVVVNTSGATDVTVDLRDGAAGSVLATLGGPSTTDTHGGSVQTFPIPITLTANTALAIDPSADPDGTVTVTVGGCITK